MIGTIGGDNRDGPGLNGDAERWAKTLARWTDELGFDTYVFWPADDAARQLERFANDVVPHVRELVDAQRR